MITAKEAYDIAKRKEPDLTQYSEYDGKYIFCYGDIENWIAVDKNTGDSTDINCMALIFEHIDDAAFCNALNDAVNNGKPISEIKES